MITKKTVEILENKLSERSPKKKGGDDHTVNLSNQCDQMVMSIKNISDQSSGSSGEDKNRLDLKTPSKQVPEHDLRKK